MGWVTPLFLAGGAAIVIPIIIHLLPRRRQPPTPLGTLRFLIEALREGRRRRHLDEFLLLAARIVVVALLAFVFARPCLQRPGSAPGHTRDVIVLIDASGSMQGGARGGTPFDDARDEARRFVDRLPDETKVTVAAFAGDVVELRERAEFTPPAGCRTDFGAALSWARRRLALSDRPHKEIVLVSDFQEAGVPAAPPADWPRDLEVTLIKVRSPASWNRAIASVEPSTCVLGEELAIDVEAASFGDAPEEECTLTVAIEGMDPLRATLGAGATRARVVVSRPAEGMYRGVASLEPNDAFPDDDCRHFAFMLRAPAEVLLVDGAPGGTPFLDATYFLEKALAVAERADERSAFLPLRRVTFDGNDEARVVALCNVARLGTEAAERLAARVSAGAGLVSFLGDATTPDAYRELARCGLAAGTLELRDGERSRPRGMSGREDAAWCEAPLAEWDATHPALAAFREREQGDLSRIRFRDVFRITPGPDDRVLARLADGTPAVVEHALGAGRVLVIANPCDRKWSDWPSQRIFLPLMREIFLYLAGETGSEAGRGAAAGATPVVRQDVPTLRKGRAPGLYGSAPLEVLAPDPAEFDPHACDRDGLAARLGLGAPPSRGDTLDDLAPPGRARDEELWRYVAAALLVCLLVEGFLADRGSP